MKGYKAFAKGLICMGKKYAENTIFEEKGAESCCNKGVMHFCETPLDTLDYYPLIDENGDMSEWAEVEALDKVLSNGNKRATKKLRIGAKLSLKKFVEASVEVLLEKTKASGDSSQLAASGNSSQLAASGDSSQLAASGNSSQLAASGDSSKLAASGDSSKLAASGYYSQLAASGYYSQLAASGNSSQLAASGDSSKLAASGKHSIAAGIGINNVAKASIGSWIVLAEWKNKKGNVIPVNVKAVQVDGETIKENVYYKLVDGEFKEVEP